MDGITFSAYFVEFSAEEEIEDFSQEASEQHLLAALIDSVVEIFPILADEESANVQTLTVRR